MSDPQVLVIEPAAGWGLRRLREVWSFRDLLYFLIWRDLKVRYRQTALGVAWAVLQPALTAVVFSFFFGRLAGIEGDGVPYPLFAYTGLLAWTFFSQGLTQASNSLVSSSNLLTKVYFPRVIVPFAAVLGGVVDLAVAFPIVAVVMAHYQHWPGPEALLAPVFLGLAFIATVGAGMWLAALNVKYRDVRHAVPFLVQLWLFLTPVIYPASAVGSMLERWGLPTWIIGLNPMAGAVEGLRWTLLQPDTRPLPVIIASIVSGVVLFISGALYFQRLESSFADVV